MKKRWLTAILRIAGVLAILFFATIKDVDMESGVGLYDKYEAVTPRGETELTKAVSWWDENRHEKESKACVAQGGDRDLVIVMPGVLDLYHYWSGPLPIPANTRIDWVTIHSWILEGDEFDLCLIRPITP